MKVLDLFSGIGGFSLGLERAGMETVAFCEFDKHAQKVLKKHWPEIPIYEDVRTLDGNQFRGSVDVICGGFPCQDISVAGNQAGIGEGTRSGLWSECARLVGEVRPKYAIFENVTALLNGAGGDWFKRVLWDISQIGYDAEWHCIPASELGAHHHRDRVWIICYPQHSGPPSSKIRKGNKKGNGNHTKGSKSASELERSSDSEVLADTLSQRQQGQREYVKPLLAEAIKKWKAINAESGCISGIWETEPELGRVADGVPNRPHRLKQLGNAVPPPVVEVIGKAIVEYEKV